MKSNEKKEKLNILLVEDNPGDIRLIKEVLGSESRYGNINIAENGVKAMEYLRREGEYKNVSQPDFIILDLNLPGKNGFEILNEIKRDNDLKIIPVLVMTTSQSDKDILESYNLHANCYITKPFEFDRFKKVMKSIESFWFSIAKLPRST